MPSAFAGNKDARTLSAFEATQPYDTAQLAGLKVLVRTACVLAALIAVGVSVWASSSLMSAWAEWMPDGQQADARPGLLKARQEIGDAFGGLTGYALRRAGGRRVRGRRPAWSPRSRRFTALRARYPRRVLIAGSLLLFYGLVLVLLALAEKQGIASSFLVDDDLRGDRLDPRGSDGVRDHLPLLERLRGASADDSLRMRRRRGLGGIRGGLLTLLHAAGVQLAGMSAADVVGILWPVLLPLMASVLAPWSLSRVRHT